MATPAEDAATEYANWQAKLAEVSANPRASYTVPGGATMNFVEYYEFLVRARDAALANLQKAGGPVQTSYVAR